MTALLERSLAPASEEELAEAIRGGPGPFRVIGGGTRWIGAVPEARALETRRLAGITLYEPGALTLVARAGTPLEEIEAALAGEGQRLAFEPPDLRRLLGRSGRSTIGGVVAANAAGPRRVQAGACRDFLLGVRFVDGTGMLVRNGGRVMKNVTGYDLVRLLAGSRGTLGVLTEVALKVLPAPEATATVSVAGLGVAAAVEAMSAALGSPYDVTGAAHHLDSGTHLRLEGFAESVRYRTGRLASLLGRFGPVEIETEEGAPLWRGIRDAAALPAEGRDIWRLSVKPSDAPRVAERLPEAALLLDWGGGLVWAATAPGFDLRAAVTGIGGHATLVRAEAGTQRGLGTFQPEAPAVARLARELRARFDPDARLNPGLMA